MLSFFWIPALKGVLVCRGQTKTERGARRRKKPKISNTMSIFQSAGICGGAGNRPSGLDIPIEQKNPREVSPYNGFSKETEEAQAGTAFQRRLKSRS